MLFMVFNTSVFAELKPHSIIVDARAEKLIKSILERLCKASGRLSVPKIYFIVDKNINAFATDEAKIFIHTGLIIQFETVDQLIAVLAHELGHITGGHIHRMSGEMRGATAASIIGTLLGGAAALAGAGFEGLIAGTMLGQGAAMGTFASFSRTHEKEADAAGFRMMQAAGFSTQGFVDTFKLFQQKNKFGEPPYLKTHPSDQERIDAVKSFIEDSPDAGSIPEEMKSEFKIIQAIFKANLQDASEVSRFYYGEKIRDTAAAKIAKVIILSRKGQYKDAFEKLEGMLCDQSDNPYLHEMYGQFLLESGNAKKAVHHLKIAVNLAPDALSIRLLYAQALFTSSGDNAQEALDQLNRITQDDPDNVMAWMLKVGAYRKLKQQDFADLAHAEALMRIGSISLAMQRAKRAQKSKDPKVKARATLFLEDSRLLKDNVD